jgi:multidrug transporter EmrE-like cation transporter
LAGKGISRDVTGLCDGFAVNTVRSLLCSLLGLSVALVSLSASGAGLSAFSLSPAAFMVSLASSFGMALFSIAWLYAYKSEAYVFLSVFTMLGAVITGVLGRIVYGDPLSAPRILGFLLLFVAVYVLSIHNRRFSGRVTPLGALTLALGTLGVAGADFMQKVFAKEGGDASVFSFYTYLLMLLPQLLALLLFRVRGTRPSRRLFDRRHLLLFFIISAALYLNTLSKAFAVKTLPATILYPTLQGANLVASAILASLLFRERITRATVLGVAVALSAVLLMNL